MLKVVIFVLMLAMIASLMTGLGFLLRDSENAGSRRLFYALGIRISLAITLVIVIGVGLYTGNLTLDAPWHPGAP